jgi:uncharacterized membrane protein
MYDALKTLHVLAVIFLGGTILVDALTGPLMGQAKTMAELRAYTRLSKINQYLGILALLLVPIFGYLTANEISIDLDITWLLLSQVLFWAAFIIGILFLNRGAFKLANRVETLPDGPIPPEIQAELRNPIFPALGGLLSIGFVFIVYLMVAKPDW